MEKITKTLQFAHLSDPHFASATFSPLQFLSKRWLGNFNYLLFRSKYYHVTPLMHLPEVMRSLGVEYVAITGDFVTTSLDSEFIEAKNFINQFSCPTLIMPGNHDCYTKQAEQSKLFYRYFIEKELEERRVTYRRLNERWHWIALDCALATPPFYAYGLFTEQMQAHVEHYLKQIPECENVIIGNHFPLFSHKRERPSHDLKRAQALRELSCKYKSIKLYLHGHDHAPYVIDKRAEGYPLVVNSGSCASRTNGGFSLFEMDERGFTHRRYVLKSRPTDYYWGLEWEKYYSFKSL